MFGNVFVAEASGLPQMVRKEWAGEPVLSAGQVHDLACFFHIRRPAAGRRRRVVFQRSSAMEELFVFFRPEERGELVALEGDEASGFRAEPGHGDMYVTVTVLPGEGGESALRITWEYSN